MIETTRPAPSTSKISHRNDFECCYLRHQYFRRAKFNPTNQEMGPYMGIVTNLTKNTYFVYINLFKAVGLHLDDVVNIGRVHLVSFLNLYALESNEKKKSEFADKFMRYEYKEPQEKDFSQKNKANFTMFFKQRMEDLVRVCRQKVRNINGYSSEEYTVFCGKSSPPKYPRRLLRGHQELGYKKVDFSIFKSIRKKANVNNDATMFKFDDLWYVAIATEQKKLTIEDLTVSDFNPYDNAHNMQPDDIYMKKELGEEADGLKNLFNRHPNNKKVNILKNFIAKNRLSRQYREEVSTARKLLKGLGG